MHFTARQRAWLSALAGCALALVTMLVPRGVAQQPRGPFSEEEVAQALKADVPPKRMATLARQYGIAFQLTPEAETRLREAGADSSLLAVLRQLAPTVAGPLLIKSNPHGAHVLLDGKLVGTTNDQGELQLAQLPPGQHRIQLKLAGYEDSEQTINLLAGRPTGVPVTLRKSDVGPLPPCSPPAGVTSFRVSHKHHTGELVIGNGKLSYRAEGDSDSFESPLGEITYGMAFRANTATPKRDPGRVLLAAPGR